MSPRAAWLLDALGFTDVSHYLGGISDWSAAALPIEGHLAKELTIGALERMGREAYAACFVLNDEGVLLGRIYRSDLRAGRGPTAADAMRPGPSVYRPDITAKDMLARMRGHNLHAAPVTTSDGKLVGLVRRGDLARAVEPKGHTVLTP